MSTIDRYKKKGGFMQLLNLIETSGKEKQEKFLKLIAEESPHWEVEIRKKMITLDKVLSWNPSYLAEIVTRIQPMTLAMVLGGLPPEKQAVITGVISFSEKRKIDTILSEKKPNPAEASSGIMKMFQEIRTMASDGIFRFEKVDETMVIPENIEELLAQGKLGTTGTANISNMSNISAAQLKDIKVAPVPSTVPAEVAEELTMLRKKVGFLTGENSKLSQELATYKDKLEQIRKIA